MNVTYSTLAASDLETIAAYYEGQKQGLGSKFLDDFEVSIAAITDSPARFEVVLDRVRRASLKRFPYLILFRESGDHIRILVVRHHSRDPNYGLEELK